MPIREPRLELDRVELNNLLGWSGICMSSLTRFVMSIPAGSYLRVNSLYVYNRGQTVVEDTERRPKECWVASVWDAQIKDGGKCLFQQPLPIKIRYK